MSGRGSGKQRYPDWHLQCTAQFGRGYELTYGSKEMCVKCGMHRPGSAHATSAAPARKPGDWDCAACGQTFIFGSKRACPKCAAPNPAAPKASYQRQPGDWDCAKCGREFIFARHTACPTCKAAKPVADRAVGEEETSAPTCVICWTHAPIMMAEPCHHKNFCNACATTQLGAGAACAVCRGEVTRYVRVFE